MSFPLKTATYNQFTSLIKSSVRRGNKELILENRNNNAWIIEYTTIFFAWKGYDPWQNQATTRRRFKRFVEYYYILWPSLQEVRKKEGLSAQQLADAMGYKSMVTQMNSCNTNDSKSFLRGYRLRTA